MQDQRTDGRLIKHSQRTVRKPCNGCGSTDLYWAHDLDRPYGRTCTQCGVAGRFVMIERDGSRHRCFGHSGDAQQPEAGEANEPAPMPASNGQSLDRLSALAQVLDTLAPRVDPRQVREVVTEVNGQLVSELQAAFDRRVRDLSVPVRVEITRNGETKALPEASHKIVPTIIKVVGNARKHVMMVGPAGTGKSTIAEQVAEALDLPYYSISLSPQTTASALLGYMQAEGKYVRTLYREAYEHGGVFHFDEFDNGHPSILATVNASLANGCMAFPDGMVKRHPDFRVMASANTYGRGADRAYVGRQALDAATLDRFVTIPVEVDEALEQALCDGSGLPADSVRKVLTYIRGLRRAAETHRMPAVIGPRSAEGMCALLAAGLSVEEAIDYRVRKGLSDQDWVKLSTGVSKPVL